VKIRRIFFGKYPIFVGKSSSEYPVKFKFPNRNAVNNIENGNQKRATISTSTTIKNNIYLSLQNNSFIKSIKIMLTKATIQLQQGIKNKQPSISNVMFQSLFGVKKTSSSTNMTALKESIEEETAKHEVRFILFLCFILS